MNNINKKQMEAKYKLDLIRTISADEFLGLPVNKTEMITRIKKELEELKAFVLSCRKNDVEFNYYEVYCKFESLSMLYLYLKEDVAESTKTR